MTANQPSPADDELLSAYLDDQLNAGERAQVEAMLAANPAARQTLDELAAQRAELRQLPRQSLGPDFAQRVLRMAEREVLVPTNQSSSGQSTGSLSTNGDLRPARDDDKPSWMRWPQGRRPWIYAGLAAAAAVAMMLSEKKQEPDHNQVAALPAKMEMSAAKPEKNEFTARLAAAPAASANTSADAAAKGPTEPTGGSVAAPAQSMASSAPAAAAPSSAAGAVAAAPAPKTTNDTEQTKAPALASAAPHSESQWLRSTLKPMGLDQYADSVLEQTAMLDQTAAGEVAEDEQLGSGASQLTIISCDINRNVVEPEKLAALFSQSDIAVAGEGTLLAADAKTAPNRPSTAQAATASSTVTAQIHAPADPDSDDVSIASTPDTPAAKPAATEKAAGGSDGNKQATNGSAVAKAASDGTKLQDSNVLFFCVAPAEQVAATVKLLQSQPAAVTNMQVVAPAGQQSTWVNQLSLGNATNSLGSAPTKPADKNADRGNLLSQMPGPSGPGMNRKSNEEQKSRNQGYAQRIVLNEPNANMKRSSPLTINSSKADISQERKPATDQLARRRDADAKKAVPVERVLFVFRMTSPQAAAAKIGTPATQAVPNAAPATSK